MSATPDACPECLRRSWLLAQLAPYIEKIATGAPGSRSPELLRLSNEDLVAAAAPAGRGSASSPASRRSPTSRLRAELAGAECWACCRHDALYPAGARATPPTPPGR